MSIGRLIEERSLELAEAILQDPRSFGGEADLNRDKCRQDLVYHLSYLAGALSAERSSLFADYVAWARVLLASLGLPDGCLTDSLTALRDVLAVRVPEPMRGLVCDYVEAGLARLPGAPTVLPTFLPDELPYADLARCYLEALLQGDRHTASRLIFEAAAAGVSIRGLYLRVFQTCQYEIGRLWQLNRISVAQEHFCTAATQLIMSQLYPYIFAGEKNGRCLVATCVSGELHEIGIRMVADLFEMDGWDTVYLGANMPGRSIVSTLEERRADVLGISATITTRVGAVADLIAAVRATPTGQRVRILIGGRLFNAAPDLWRSLGADGYAGNAEEALVVAGRWLAQT
jgi:MerR family transcriptional regulator, light-induced transcriptional regulator